MPTLNEKFRLWCSKPDGIMCLHSKMDNVAPWNDLHSRVMMAFLAGAKAEREEVLEIIKDEAFKAIQRTAGVTPIGSMVHEVERQIKERGDA